jgi:acyl-CoA thioesterase-1
MARSVARSRFNPSGRWSSTDQTRRRLLGLVAAMIGSAVTAGYHRPALADPTPRKLLVLGDSLSAEYGLTRGTGWVALLSKRLAEKRLPYEVINASISGETTSGGQTRLAQLLERHQPAVVVIELGGNDALRGLPLASTEDNLRTMVKAAKKSGAQPLLLGMMMPPNYGRAYGEQFASSFKRVADGEKVALVPFFLAGIGDRAELFQADRIHPTERAQPLMLDNVWPVLSKLVDVK